MKYNKEIKYITWDITKPTFFLPKSIKKIYFKNYFKYFKSFNNWINEISKDNSNNINWWLSRPASRDERLSNLFKNICVLRSLPEIDKKDLKVKIICDSNALKKIVLNKSFKNINIISNQKNLFSRIFIFLKEIFILVFNILLIKIIYNFELKENQKINLVDFFNFKKQDNIKRLFGNYIKDTNIDFKFVPTFLSFSPKNILSYKNKKNILLKEYFINFSDLIFIVKNLIFKKIKIKKKFIKSNFTNLIKEELKIDNNLRSILIGYFNYLFFKNLKTKKIIIKNILSWHENQVVDKGWSLGINKYYPVSKFFGYQASTLHPQFFNLSQTPQEVMAGAAPKNIFLIGRKYLKNRTKFYKKIKFKYTAAHRFKFKKNISNKIYILFLLSGIREIDELFIQIFNKIDSKKFKNLKIKFHPILASTSFKGNYSKEIKGDGSNIINSSKVVITTSYTSGLYESLARSSLTLMIETNPFDTVLFQDLKRHSNRIFLVNQINQIEQNLKNFSKRKIKFSDNRQIKYSFFNK